MRQEKLVNYHLTASIHTLQIHSPGAIVDVQPDLSQCITPSIKPDKDITTSKINPNKLSGTLYSYAEFERVFNAILCGAGIYDYVIKRVDLSFDNYDPEHYQEFAKLNRCLISLMATTYEVRNAYRTINLFTQRQLSVAAKNKYFEIEHYDKLAESDGKAAATSRLELRSKYWKDRNIKAEFMRRWPTKLAKCIQHYEEMQEIYNDNLEELYRLEHGSKRTKQIRKYRTVIDFVLAYQDCIFSKRQLVDFLARFDEIDDPEATATYIKKKYHIEYISISDMRYVINEIKRATKEFFESK